MKLPGVTVLLNGLLGIRVSSSGLCDDLDGWDWGVWGLSGRSRRDAIYVYM